jgi:hypothetical protein
VGVVEVEPVAEHRVREGGVRRRQAGVEPDHGRLRLAAELGHRRPALAGDSQAVRGETATEHVQYVQLRGVDHLVRDRVQVQLEREGRKPFCCRGHQTLQSSAVPGKLRFASGAPRL